MPFIQDILKNKSVSIVGMAKNTGKTTCLNYVLGRLEEEKCRVAVTSIGVDGEERDILYDTLKPRILLKKSNYFITSEKHFEERELEAEILSISNKTTALGRLITAKVIKEGKVILSGPSDSIWLHDCIESLNNFKTDIVLVDGALSRMSLASPAITDAMVLCTGAACAIQLEQLIKKVKYICGLINISQVNDSLYKLCNPIQEGVWGVSKDGKQLEKIATSLFIGLKFNSELVEKYKYFYIAGALTESFLKTLSIEKKVSNINLIVKDFSKIFVQSATFNKFIRRGGNIQVLKKANLIAVCTNPTSPESYNYEPEVLRNAIQNELNIPVYDVMQEVNKKYNKI